MSASFPVVEDTRWRVSTATALQTSFSIPFAFQRRTDVAVWREDLTGLIHVLTLDVHFTITGQGSPGGGTLTLLVPAQAGERIYRIGQADLDRLTSVVRAGKFSSEALDDDLDRTMIALMEFRRDVDRAWTVAFGQSAGSIAIGAPSTVAMFDQNGNLVEGPSVSDISAAQEHAETAAAAAALIQPLQGAIAALADIDEAIVEVANVRAQVAALGAIDAQIVAVFNVRAQVVTVADNAVALVAAANNMPAIIDAPNQASAAAGSATLAQRFATHPEDTDIPGTGGLRSALHWAMKAAASAGITLAQWVGAVDAFATKATPANADRFGYVQNSDGTGRKTTWGDIKTALAALFLRFDVAQALTIAQKAQGMANLGVPLTLEYVSAPQTITAGGLLTLTHGLGALPKFVVLELVCIAIGDGTYAVGDRVFINPSFNTRADTGRGAAILPTSTNIGIRYGSNVQTFEVLRKDTGDALVLNNVRWQLVVRAWA